MKIKCPLSPKVLGICFLFGTFLNFFLSNLPEGYKKYFFPLKNSKKNTGMHSTCQLIFAEHSATFSNEKSLYSFPPLHFFLD